MGRGLNALAALFSAAPVGRQLVCTLVLRQHAVCQRHSLAAPAAWHNTLPLTALPLPPMAITPAVLPPPPAHPPTPHPTSRPQPPPTSPSSPLPDQDLSDERPTDYDCRCFFLHRPRLELYRRIDARVEDMVAGGLLQVRQCIPGCALGGSVCRSGRSRVSGSAPSRQARQVSGWQAVMQWRGRLAGRTAGRRCD